MSHAEDLNAFQQYISTLPQPVLAFLMDNAFYEKWQEIKSGHHSGKIFEELFFEWFDRIMVMKFFNHTKGNFYSEVPVEEAAMKLMEISGNKTPGVDDDPWSLLKAYRGMQNKLYGERQNNNAKTEAII
jgi:hypothetical protein